MKMEKTEQGLLTELQAYQRLLEEHKNHRYNTDEYHDNHSNESRIGQIEQQIVVVERELSRITETPITDRKRAAILKTISLIIKALNPIDSHYSISRNQGMVLRNYLYARIIYDLNNAFDQGENDISDPEYLYELNQDVDYKTLQHLLQTKSDELLVSKFNYISLRDFVRSMKKDILELYNTDY